MSPYRPLTLLTPGLAAAGGAALAMTAAAGPLATLAAAALAATGATLLTGEGRAGEGRAPRGVPLAPRASRASNARAPAPAAGDPVSWARPEGLPVGVGLLLLEKLPMGVVLIDDRGHVLFTNAMAVEIIGRRPPGEFHSSALRVPRLLEAIEGALADRLAAEVSFSITRGAEMHLKAHVRPVAAPARALAGSGGGTGTGKGQGERLPSVMVVIEDVTAARRADELNRDFVANASHELKTPLASIAGAIETLQGHARGDPEATERFLALMAAQAERMKRLVNDLLSLNRIELNERVTPRSPLRLSEVVREASEAMAPQAEAAGCRLLVVAPAERVRVAGNFEELSTALRNLIENAIRYGREGGQVEVSCLEEDAAHPGQVGLGVRDDGPGIPSEHLPRLTERFYRVSVNRSRARGGTGLGLAIVKHVVSRHRGRLEIESTPGRGSCFTVWLPRLPER